MLLNHIRKFFAKPASNMIVRRVKVNRARSPQEAIEATSRAQYLDRKVVDEMPRGEGDEVEVVFFKLSSRNGFISEDDLKKEYALRGLKSADPYSVAAVNEADPAFADEKPNATHWKNHEGGWCCVLFFSCDDERGVNIYRCNGDWDDDWWFAGLRK